MTSNQPSSESHSSVHNQNDNVSHSGDPDGDSDPDADADTRSSDRSNPAPSAQPAAKRTAAKRSRRSSMRVQDSKAMTSTTTGATRASQRHHHQRNASPKHRLMSAATQAGVRQTEPYNFFYTDMVVNLFGRDDAKEFRQPVLKLYTPAIIPNYKDLVKNPMDLGTIKNRLANTNFYFCKRPAHTPVEDRWKYLHELDARTSAWFQVDERKLLADIRLVFENCKTYNDDSSDIHQTAVKFMKDIDAKLRLRNKRLQTMKKAALNAASQTEVAQGGAGGSKLDSSVASGSAFPHGNGNSAEALERARLEAEEEKRKALEEMRRKELEWQTRLVAEKDAAVKAAVAQVNQQNSFIIQQQQYQQELQTIRMHQMQHQVRTQLELLQAQQQQQQQQHHGPKQLLNDALQQGVPKMPQSTRRHSKRGREITRVRYAEDDADDDEDEFEEEDGVIVDDIAVGQGGGREGGSELKVGRSTTMTTTTSDSVICDDRQHANIDQEQTLEEEMHADGSGGSGALGIGGRNGQNDVIFVFVSTDGMEKKRGRKSARVAELEVEHEGLVKRRKMMVDTTLELEKLKQVEMTVSEKRTLCEEVAGLDYVRMKGVVDLLARGLSRPDLLSEVEIDLDMDAIDNVLLREIQFFLRSPVAMTAKEALRTVEEEIVGIEKQLVVMRYQKVQKDQMIE